MENDKPKTKVELTGELQDLRQVIDQLHILEAEHKQAEHKLIASEVRYRRLFETAHDGILIIDANTGNITDVNPFIMQLLGYPKEHFLGKQLWEIGFFKDSLASQEAFLELQTNGFIRYEDLPLETVEGLSIDVEFVSNVYRVDGESVIQCNIRDITVRKKAELALLKVKASLEVKVKKRTAKLSRANKQLRFYAAKVIQAHEDERKQVACELHDELGQSLTALNLMINQAASAPSRQSLEILGEAKSIIGELIRQVREMSLDLRPSMLDDLGLLPAVQWYVNRYNTQTNIKITFEHSGLNRKFSPQINIAIYRIVQEALTNIARHAKTDAADINIRADAKSINLVIKDRGAGFNMATLLKGTSTGLSGMRERVLVLGGTFNIESHSNMGTNLTAKIPLDI